MADKDASRYQDPDRPDVSTHLYPYWFKFMMFYIMGIGPNWVMPTALGQEIPYFENHQPEGISIAAYMNAATSSALLVVFAYYGYTEYVGPIPHSVAIPALLFTSAFSAFLSVAIYDVTAGNVSICLYLCCFLSGCVGSVSQVAMNPFMTNYQNDFISATRSGGSGTILLIALISLAQGPGSDNPRFSPRMFFLIFGLILTAPIAAYRFIIRSGLGLKPKERAIAISGKSPQLALASIEDEERRNGNAINPLQNTEKNDCNDVNLSQSETLPNIIYKPELVDRTALDFIGRACAQFVSKYVLSDKIEEEKRKWIEVLIPYMFCVAWIDFNTWGLMTAFIPFAIDYATADGDGSENLAIAYQVSAFTLFLGDLSTAVFKLPISYSIALFTICSFTVNSAAFSTNEENFNKPGVIGLIIFFFVLARFLEAHLLTSTFRVIATTFPPHLREECSKHVGLVDQTFTTMGTILSTSIIAASRR